MKRDKNKGISIYVWPEKRDLFVKSLKKRSKEQGVKVSLTRAFEEFMQDHITKWLKK